MKARSTGFSRAAITRTAINQIHAAASAGAKLDAVPGQPPATQSVRRAARPPENLSGHTARTARRFQRKTNPILETAAVTIRALVAQRERIRRSIAVGEMQFNPPARGQQQFVAATKSFCTRAMSASVMARGTLISRRQGRRWARWSAAALLLRQMLVPFPRTGRGSLAPGVRNLDSRHDPAV
jgi:hypothetical protein